MNPIRIVIFARAPLPRLVKTHLIPALGERQWIIGLGPGGPFLFALTYILGAVLFVPETPLSIAGGWFLAPGPSRW